MKQRTVGMRRVTRSMQGSQSTRPDDHVYNDWYRDPLIASNDREGNIFSFSQPS